MDTSEFITAENMASSDPFLGMGHRHLSPAPSSPGGYASSSSGDINYDLDYELGSDYTIGTHQGTTRRVRIALKSLPQSTGEGGEWEIELR